MTYDTGTLMVIGAHIRDLMDEWLPIGEVSIQQRARKDKNWFASLPIEEQKELRRLYNNAALLIKQHAQAFLDDGDTWWSNLEV